VEVYSTGSRFHPAPEDLVVDAMDATVAERGVYGACLDRITGAVLMAVMHDRVGEPADEVFGLPAKHSLRGRVQECRLALRIHAVDALAGGMQDELVAAFELAKDDLKAILVRATTAIELVDLGLRATRADCAQVVDEGQDELTALVAKGGR
jgi:hypothetical protein